MSKSTFHVMMGGGHTSLSGSTRKDHRTGLFVRDTLPEHRAIRTLYISNISINTTEISFLQVLNTICKPIHVQYIYHTYGELQGQPRGFAFIELETQQDADIALSKLHGYKYDNSVWSAQRYTIPLLDDNNTNNMNMMNNMSSLSSTSLRKNNMNNNSNSNATNKAKQLEFIKLYESICTYNDNNNDDNDTYIQDLYEDDETPIAGLQPLSVYKDKYDIGRLYDNNNNNNNNNNNKNNNNNNNNNNSSSNNNNNDKHGNQHQQHRQSHQQHSYKHDGSSSSSSRHRDRDYKERRY